MDPHARRVDHLHLAVVRGDHRVHEPVPYACFAPAVEAVVDRRRRSVALGDVRPGRARAQDPENPVQNSPVIDAGNAARLVWQHRLDRLPLEIRQIVARHDPSPFRELESVFAQNRHPFMSLRPKP